MRRLEDKIIAVVGAGSGIGAATAQRLAAEGATAVVADVNAAAARSVAAAIVEGGGKATAVACDIADEASVAAMVHAIVATHGGIDGIHVNAADMRAIISDGDALEVSLDIFDRTLAVNLRGHLLCTRHALPEMLKRGGGAIVYTSSGAADMGEPTRVSYAVSKAGLQALMRHVASRWGKQGIRANAIAPGLVITEQLRGHFPENLRQATLAITRSPRLGQSEDIAAMVAMLMSADGAWINGQVLGVDGGACFR
ncbi:MAG TPA: SDR family oxidoreductase [Solimonas sp.]|nr:SDR family oxidoreductase [Solimonas sp.]